MVPSWTEMLIECGIEVVGRTRFCIHPLQAVKQIPVVGGTKDIDWLKVQDLKADLLILDQEENPRSMSEQSPIPWIASHVTSVSSVEYQLEKLNEKLVNPKVAKLAQRWRQVAKQKRNWNWNQIPGELEVLRRDFPDYQKIVYVIWKNPWMRVATGSFISSVLESLGAEKYLMAAESKYPTFELSDFDPKETYFLFSSEPFPFRKQKQDLKNISLQASIVDGECFSWFGLRSLRFLETWLNCQP